MEDSFTAENEPPIEGKVGTTGPVPVSKDPVLGFEGFLWTCPLWWPFVFVQVLALVTVLVCTVLPSLNVKSFIGGASLVLILITVIMFVVLLTVSKWFREKSVVIIGLWIISFPMFLTFTGLTQGAIVSGIEKTTEAVKKKFVNPDLSK